ncbi:hypothetical protein D3C76_902290 [compost metagenome]
MGQHHPLGCASGATGIEHRGKLPAAAQGVLHGMGVRQPGLIRQNIGQWCAVSEVDHRAQARTTLAQGLNQMRELFVDQ